MYLLLTSIVSWSLHCQCTDFSARQYLHQSKLHYTLSVHIKPCGLQVNKYYGFPKLHVRHRMSQGCYVEGWH